MEDPVKKRRKSLSLGNRAADKLAKVAGSWGFIFFYLIFLVAWIFLNIYLSVEKRWDEYPFILLNLFLSCLAAIQAPIILMSQNRAAKIDRKREEYDYAVNRKTERQIEKALDKLDLIEKKLKNLK